MRLFQLTSYLSYWLDAVDEHSLHSPFFYDFYTQVVKADQIPLSSAELLRQKLLSDHRRIHVEDFGTRRTGNRLISDIAKKSLTTVKFSVLYQRLIADNKFSTIVELGTSLGINSLYMASTPGTSVTTFEGSDQIAAVAEMTFEFAGASNVSIIKGNINQTLSHHLQILRKIDFAFMDANHTYEATVQYFKILVNRLHEKSIVVVDDIHLNPGMEKAWKELKNSRLVYGSADLYRAGILFFDPSLNKQHVILQF